MSKDIRNRPETLMTPDAARKLASMLNAELDEYGEDGVRYEARMRGDRAVVVEFPSDGGEGRVL